MPIYEFNCAAGHRTERRVSSITVAALPCPECAQTAIRSAVNRFATPRTWADDFVVPVDARRGLAEVDGYKEEARAAMEEAVANGWKPEGA